jgi:hypothetical protein
MPWRFNLHATCYVSFLFGLIDFFFILWAIARPDMDVARVVILKGKGECQSLPQRSSYCEFLATM